MVKLKKFLLVFISVLFLFALGMNPIKPKAKYNPIKLDENITMGLRLEQGTLVVDYLDNFSEVNTFKIGNFDMYGILNEEGQVSYYLADIFQNENYIMENLKNIVVKAMIYNENEIVFDITKPKKLELQYYNSLDNDVFSIAKDLEMSDFRLLTRFTQNLTLEDDELSDRLRSSMNIKSSFDSLELEEEKNLIQGIVSPMAINSLYTNKNKTVMVYNYDQYTKTDHYAHLYQTDYFNVNYKNGVYSDDWITKVVPKHLMFTVGTHSYVGKEYGFSIHTTRQSTDLYVSDVFIYDIFVQKPMVVDLYNDRALVEVRPLYQYRYYARNKGSMSNTEWNRNYDSSLTQVVYKHNNYNAPNYYLKDVQVKFTFTNLGKPNQGDTGYSSYNDYGANVINAEYFYNGEGKSTGRNDYAFPYFDAMYQTQYSFYPTANDIYSSGNLVIKHSNDLPLDIKHGVHDSTNKSFSLDTPYDSRTKQLNYWGMPIKAVTVNRRTQAHLNNENPLLIGTRTSNNYIQAKAYTEYRFSSAQTHENELHVSIGADFVRDDTYFLLFLKLGQLTVLDTVEGSYNYGGFHMMPMAAITSGTPGFSLINGAITYRGGSLYFIYSVSHHALFDIQTYSSSNTSIEIYSHRTGEFIASSTSGGVGQNAKISKVFEPGLYFFKINFTNINQLGTLNFHMSFGSRLTFPSNANYLMFNTWEQSTFIKVYVPNDSYYRIGGLGDYITSVAVFDSNGFFVAEERERHPNRYGDNGMFDTYLEGGDYYLLMVRIELNRFTWVGFEEGGVAGVVFYDLWA